MSVETKYYPLSFLKGFSNKFFLPGLYRKIFSRNYASDHRREVSVITLLLTDSHDNSEIDRDFCEMLLVKS